MDILNRFFDVFERVFSQASWKAAFGEPQVHGDRTIIPVASVTYGFGMGAGMQTPQAEEEAEVEIEAEAEAEDEAGTMQAAKPASGGGVGGGGQTVPIALIQVTPQRVSVKPIIHWQKLILTALITGAWSSFWWAMVAREDIRSRRTS